LVLQQTTRRAKNNTYSKYPKGPSIMFVGRPFFIYFREAI
jgi:hypothetical protein